MTLADEARHVDPGRHDQDREAGLRGQRVARALLGVEKILEVVDHRLAERRRRDGAAEHADHDDPERAVVTQRHPVVAQARDRLIVRRRRLARRQEHDRERAARDDGEDAGDVEEPTRLVAAAEIRHQRLRRVRHRHAGEIREGHAEAGDRRALARARGDASSERDVRDRRDRVADAEQEVRGAHHRSDAERVQRRLVVQSSERQRQRNRAPQDVRPIAPPARARAIREGAHDRIDHAVEDRRRHIYESRGRRRQPDGVGVIEHQEQRDALPVEIEAVVADGETDFAGDAEAMRLQLCGGADAAHHSGGSSRSRAMTESRIGCAVAK